ncbi:hypothetical protein [Bradyrhizobium sp. dw_411]|uniref:hypothetical protein n=1 Tax=Bradyrhizobium sp. dw_411 TaxID=2720082 RepID=UPI001BCBF3BA|nr:hypothetical protein [Bradyrhizobium sp. dw_411]
MNALIIPFVPRRDRKRHTIGFSIPAPPPDDLVMDHADTAPCEYVAPEEGDAVFVENIHA